MIFFSITQSGVRLSPAVSHVAMMSSYRLFFNVFISTALITLCGIAPCYYYFFFFNNHNHNNIIITSTSLLQPVNSSPIPKKIWYKVGPAGLTDEIHSWTQTCITQNPNYEYIFLTDESADSYVASAFSHRADITSTYLNLSIPILKADLLRYMLLYEQGGVWFDLDVSCQGIRIDYWVPKEYEQEAKLVVGWEFDVGEWDFDFMRQFATWTVLASPGSPHLIAVIEDILSLLHAKASVNNVSISGLTLDMVGDVVDITGPRRLTESIFMSLGRTLGRESFGGDEEAKGLRKPKLIGDVLIMPGRAFASSANVYKEGERAGGSLVAHHYVGSWKNKHGGEVI